MSDTIPARLLERAEQTPSRPAYYAKVDGAYVATSWAEYSDQVRRAGKALMALGFQTGQITTVLGFNRPEWVVLDVATMAVGGAPAGIYTTSSAEEVEYIVGHAEAPVILVENEDQLAKVLQVRARLPQLHTIVMMQGASAHDDPSVLTWDEFLAKGDGVDDADFLTRLRSLEPDQVATLIYTSGTTGPPKGVMLTHHNLTWTADAVETMIEVGPEERSISYLPLSHIAEQMFTIHIPITFGSQIYFAESIDQLAENIKEVRPTIFFAVPRVWEKFHMGVAAELAKSTGLKAKIAAWAQKVGRDVVHLRNASKEPAGMLKAQYGLANKLVHHKVQEAIGLDRSKVLVSGAAPISPEVLEFFAGFDLTVLEIYGQSEGTGPTTFNRPGKTKFGSVGPAYPGSEVKLADDGEVLLKGGNVFAGYYKNDEATKETLADGWLYSGDLGSFDAEGFLTITGRKKDIIITAGGKNIAPKNLEAGLKDSPLVSEAVVIGDRRKYLTALVTLDAESLAAYASEHGLEGDPHVSPEVIKEIQAAVDRVNDSVARVEQIKKFTILPRELSIADGELTGTLKVKRNVVTDHFAQQIDAMYVD